MRKVCLIVFPMLVAVLAMAVPSYTGEIEVYQPDGLELRVHQVGDEFSHYVLYDGRPIAMAWDGWWKYLIPSDKGIEMSSRLVGIDSPPVYDREDFGFYSPEAIHEYQGVAPAAGTLRFPVILINYSDTEFIFDKESVYTDMLEEVRAYYLEISRGKLMLEFTVVGWYTASGSHDYYGEDLGWKGNDRFPRELVREAVEAADPFLDFSNFDNDGNGSVDNVIVIHQGAGQEISGDATDIWSHSWAIDSVEKDGVSISAYTIQPETLNDGEIATIGVLCHEFGHALGLPDLYDTDGSSWAIGDWGLMAHGAWNNVDRPGDSPVHPTGWCKSRLDWLEPIYLNEFAGDLEINPVETDGEIYVYENQDEEGAEYFLFENRQKTGYDASLPGEGLIIYHVDEEGSQRNDSHRKIDIEEADNDFALDSTDTSDRGSGGDPFPGTSLRTLFDSSSLPDSDFYEGCSHLRLSDISSNSGVVGVEIHRENYPSLDSPYIYAGNGGVFQQVFGGEIEDYEIIDPGGMVISSFKDYDSIVLRIDTVDSAFCLSISMTYVDESTETVDYNFLPFSYITVPDGATNNRLILVREFGWNESPEDGWSGGDSVYWKWYDTGLIEVFDKSISD